MGGRFPLRLWGVQLIFNVGWCWCFLGFHQPGLAFAETTVAWVPILATLPAFGHHWRSLSMSWSGNKIADSSQCVGNCEDARPMWTFLPVRE